MEQLIPIIIEFLKANPYFSLIAAVVTAASTITAVTPTPNPDTFWGKAYKILDLLALNIGNAKDTGK